MQSVRNRANTGCTMDKRSLSERDICTKFILPAVTRAGWDKMLQVREEVYFTKGRIIVRGKLVTRGKAKKADFVLYSKQSFRDRGAQRILRQFAIDLQEALSHPVPLG